MLACAAVVIGAAVAGPMLASAIEGATSVDPDTTNAWENFTAPDGVTSTQNVGRIWTDKSVFDDTYTFEGQLSGSVEKGDSDFLVGLSALSSTSNLTETTTTSTPLDIVLVLDTSGSMDDDMGEAGWVESYDAVNPQDVRISHGEMQTRTYWEWFQQHEYQAAVQLTRGGEYYVKVGDEYVRVNEVTHTVNGERNTSYEEHDAWRVNGQDVDPSTTTFYEHNRQWQDAPTKMDALQEAADAFINNVASMNDDIADTNQQHRIALVKFASNNSSSIGNDFTRAGYNCSQIVSGLQAYTSANASNLTDTVDGLRPTGATQADYGLAQAERALNGAGSTARPNAKKVVIFFTDGNPTSGSSWEGSVAADAINNAYDLKDAGVTVYSIGVFDGANPSDTQGNFNKYMNAVSSNYPDAECADWRGQQTNDFDDLDMGDRVSSDDPDEPAPQYYFSAENSEQLDQVFEDITSSMTENTGSGSPIQSITQAGAHETPGNLTFTDQLGSYMEVTGTGAGTDKMQLAYADQLYTSTSRDERQIQGGTVYTYHFDGQVAGNAVYGPADLSSITVEVTHYNDAAQGDLVQVTIPASLIPLRNYDVNADNNTMTVTEAYPIRLFYGVSLKQAAEEAITAGSGDVYDAIAQSNVSADKKTLDFYTNLYTNDNGDTTAVFTPNEANKFYYYTSDTPLYVDEACTERATRQNIDQYNKVYYQDTYYVQTEKGDYEQRTTSVAVNRDGSEFSHIAFVQWGSGYGNAYMPEHTQRTDRPATLNTNKSENNTSTAATALVPSWSGANEVTQALGNNGKISYPMPGSLEIKKTVDWTNGSDQTQQDKNSFIFGISLTDANDKPISGTYNYYVDNAETASGQVTFTDDGKASIQVNGGTTVRIDGLASGAKFTVTEQGVGQNGFTVTSDSTSQTDVENTNTTDGIVTGTIPAGSQASLSFDNKYHAEDVNLSTNATLQVKKNLNGRDWRDIDEFTFAIDGLANTAEGNIPTPEPDETTIKIDDETTDYTKAFGDITFTAPGEYRYSVVEDNDTNPIAGIDYSDAIYRVVVTVTDNGTGQLVVSDVKIEQTQNDEGSMGAQDDPVAVEGTTMTFTNNYNAGVGTTNINAVKNYTDTTGTNPINLNKFQFQIEALGGYETDGGSSADYTVDKADVPMPAGSDGTTKQVGNTGSQVNFGTITYDGNDTGKTFEYKVTEVAGTEKGMTYDKTEYTVQVKVEEVTDDAGTHIVATVLGDYADPSNLSFSNTYDPKDAELKGENAIHGTKTLTGREMNEGETFHFQLTQTNGPKTLDPNDDENVYVSVLSAPEYASVSRGDEDMAFSFDDMTFSVAGTYTFQVNEVADDQGTETTNGAGLTYDMNICTVTVTVTDNHDGTMTATPSYSNQGHSETDQAVFANTYQASMNYGANGAGGINVTKQMLDRPMANGDFSFTITPKGEDTAYETFSNTAAEKDGTVTMKQLQNLTFDQNDAGKTFTYIVDESDPAEGAALPEVDYDQSQYKVEIAVYDIGNGTMHTVTTVTKIKNADGGSVNDVVVNAADSSADGYTAPTFGFVNDYNPNGTTAGGESAQWPLQVTKTVEGAPSPASVEYFFTLTPAEDYGDKVTGLTDGKLTAHTTGSIAEGESQTVDFGQLTFTEPGIYTFNVQEDQPTADDGWTFDDADGNDQTDTHQITVVVTDLNNEGAYDGNLYIQSVTGSPAQVTNSYHANEITVGGEGAAQQISVQKTVTGADSTDNFKFKLEPIVDETNTEEVWANNVALVDPDYDGTATINGGVTQAQAGTATFGGLTFKAEGTYQFKVTEVQAHDSEDDPDGWTYDEHTSVVTVKVTDEGNDGQLDAAVSYDNSAATTDSDKGCTTAAAFTNAYTTSGTLSGNGEEAIKVTKSLTGRANDEWLDGDSFKAMLTAQESTVDGQTMAADSVPMPGGRTGGVATVDLTKDNHESVAFGDITYTRPGTYNYTLAEVQENAIDGVYYSLAEYNVVVAATDNGNGTMTVTSEITQTKDDDGFGSSEEGYTGSTESVDVATFTNVYQPNFATFDGAQNLTVSKNLEGRDWYEGDEWTFALALTDGDASKVIMPAQTQLTINANTPNFAASFGNITFRAAGTYIFTVTESGIVEGVTNDTDAERTIVVDVTDDTKGNLTAEVDAENSDGLTFTNTYQPGSVTIGGDSAIKVQKTLTGRDWADGEEFGFTIKNTQRPEGVENAPMPENANIEVSKPAEGNVATAQFGNMTFTQAGTYVYEITENEVADEHLTPDKHTATVMVAVFEDQTDGTLSAQVSYDNGGATTDGDKAVTDAAAFTNAYSTESFDLSFSGTKHLDGRDFRKGDTFTFTVNAGADVPVPDGVTVTKQDESSWTGEITISPESGNDAEIDFGKARISMAGEYTYLITEQNTGIDGMGYDETTHTVTFKAEDNGQGGFNVTQTAGDLTWVNTATYQPGDAVSLTGTKTMTGKELTNGQFTFMVEPQGGAPMGSSLPTAFNGDPSQNEDGSWTAPIDLLTNVTYDEPGKYVYLVSEVNDGQPGITYDGTQYRVTVTVAQDGSVTTKIEKSTDGMDWTEASAVDFSNSYAAKGSATLDGSANLSGTKTLSGRDWTGTDSFTFVLAAGDRPTQLAIDDGAIHMPETMEVVQGGFSDGARVPFNFGNIVFDEAGIYKFTISEQQPSDESFVGPTAGMTYDTHTRIITVTVADNGNGQLEATAEAEGDANWTNTYTAGGEDNPGTLSGAENLVVTKVIDGRDWQEGDSFTFQLTADANNPAGATLPENASGLTITNETEGHKAAFGDITFTQPGNYTFYVNELVPADENKLGGMTYDGEARTIEVSVMDNLDGTLTATATVTSEHGLTFINTYKHDGTTTLPAKGEGSITLRKILGGKAWNGDEFTFKLNAVDSASAKYLPEQTEVTVSAKTGTNAEGNDFADFTFGPITYDQPGVYTYTVTEVAAGNAGIQYDTHAATVTVTVSDNMHGGLTASAVVEEGTFTNTYETTPFDLSFSGTKHLVGRDFQPGDVFTFTVSAAADVPVPDGVTVTSEDESGWTGKVTIRPESGNDAVIDFGSVNITEPGEYTYQITEQNTGIPGMTYDETTHTVTFNAEDNGRGGFNVTMTAGNLTWVNTYAAGSVTDEPTKDDGGITVTKVLDGRDLVAGEFEFQLVDANGNVVATGTNDANGDVTLSDVTFDEPGDYDFTLVEVTGDLDNVTYDQTTYHVIAHVTDNGNGTLSVVWDVEGVTDNTAVFTNTYEEPGRPPVTPPDEPDNPDTPDEPDTPDTPDEPDTPDVPDTPDQPGTPGQPGNPGTPEQPVMPETGDPTNPVLPIALAAGGIALVAGAVVLRVRKDQ